jgi:protein phosphatase
VRNLFRKSIVEQSRQVRAEGQSESGYKGMGATVVVLLLKKKRAYLANLGDSRIYRLRKKHLKQLSKDHSVVSELLEKGEITPGEAENHSDQGLITQYMGMEKKEKPHLQTFLLQPKDRILLCTDGLTDMVSDPEISNILIAEPNPQTTAEQLIRAANQAGGHDNITAIVVDWPG